MQKVLIKTNMGHFTVRLYDETPVHRDNFIKLVREGFYTDLLFHRVIKGFMIQGGDPNSRDAAKGVQLGAGGVDYTLPAEMVYPKLFHKKGALAAARLGDDANPERRSSGCQFYIVTGEVYSAGKLTQLEKQMAQQQMQQVFDALVVENRSKIIEMRKNRDQAGIQALQDQLVAQTKAKCKELGDPKFTDEQRQVYTTVGGTPFLDNNYTVFGEVEQGIEVAEAIEKVATAPGDRPLEDVKILSAEVIE